MSHITEIPIVVMMQRAKEPTTKANRSSDGNAMDLDNSTSCDWKGKYLITAPRTDWRAEAYLFFL